jgi:catechol 2,3-dioxygenase-like lactoylglutathione lyase family enzyme
MSLNIRQLAHVCVFSHDLAAAEAFYCGALGLTKTFDFTKNGTRAGFYLACGGRTFIEVFLHPDAPFEKTGVVNHLCLEVPDIQSAAAELRAKGLEVTEAKYGVDDTWQVWLKDPSGSPIELFQYTDASAQFKGGDREIDW